MNAEVEAQEAVTKAVVDQVMKENIFYIVKYDAVIVDENKKEDTENKLGEITLVKYVGDTAGTLEQKELKTDGSTTYVAHAGDKIQVVIKSKDSTTEKTAVNEVLSEKTVKTETGTEIITKKVTTSKVGDIVTTIDYVFGDVSFGEGITLTEVKGADGTKTYELTVPETGGVNIDLEQLIKLVTSADESGLKEVVTEEILSRVAKKTDNGGSDDSGSSSGGSSSGGSSSGGSSSGGGGGGSSYTGSAGGWEKAGDGWKYKYSSGSYAKSCWLTDKGNKYCMDENGYMVTGWRVVGDQWYYFSEKPETLGKMVTGWIKDTQDNNFYYLSPADGHMLTGWQEIDGKMYFLNPMTPEQTWFYSAESDRWIWGGSNVKPLGAMYANEQTPDGAFVGGDGARM